MNFNKYDFIPGDIVELDRDHPNHSEVMIVSMTKGTMFSRVVPAALKNPTDKDAWDVMTNRLTPITPNHKKP